MLEFYAGRQFYSIVTWYLLVNNLTFTVIPISIEGVASIAAACVGANGVAAILDTTGCVFSTLINV